MSEFEVVDGQLHADASTSQFNFEAVGTTNSNSYIASQLPSFLIKPGPGGAADFTLSDTNTNHLEKDGFEEEPTSDPDANEYEHDENLGNGDKEDLFYDTSTSPHPDRQIEADTVTQLSTTDQWMNVLQDKENINVEITAGASRQRITPLPLDHEEDASDSHLVMYRKVWL